MLTKALLAFSMLALWSCSSDVRDLGDQLHAPFEASEVSAVRVESIAQKPMWSDIKNGKVMTLKTCLTDKATGAPVADESFEILGGQGKTQKVRTRMDGCLYWVEEFNFNYLSSQKLFQIDRVLKGAGNYGGQARLELAVDLWAEQNTVIDRSTRYIGRKLYSASQENLSLEPGFENFYLDKVDIYATNLVHSQNFVEFDLRSVLTPVFQRRDLNGSTIKERLTTGVFTLELWLLERKPGENRFKILAQAQENAYAQNGILDNTLQMQVDSRPDMQSELLIGLRLTPIAAPEGLRPLTGFVAFENLRSVSDIRPLEEKIEDFLYRNKDGFATDNFGMLIEGNIQALKGDMAGSAYANSANRVYNTEFNFCLVDAFTGKRLKETSVLFELRDLDTRATREQIARVNANGCVQVYEDLEYNELSTQYKNVQVAARGMRAPYYDVSVSQNFKIKQWQKTGTVSYHGKVAGEKRNADIKIYSNEMSLTALGKDSDGFHLNENMELSITRRYVLEMPLSVIHPHNPSGPMDYSSLNFGDYKLSYAMYSPKNDKSALSPANVRDLDLVHYATLEPSQIKVENGRLRAEISLETAYFDFHKLLYENMFLARIEPVNLKEVAASTFYGNAVLGKGSTRVSLASLSDDLINLVDVNVMYMAAKKRKIRPAGSAMTISFYRNHLKNIFEREPENQFESYYLNAFNQAYGQNMAQSDIANFKIDDKEALKALCDVFYEEEQTRTMRYRGMMYQMGPTPMRARCEANPAQFIQVEKTKHIQYLRSAPEQLGGEGSSVSTGQAYFISEGHQSAHETGSRSTVGTFAEMRAGGKLFGLVGVEAGAKVSYELYSSRINATVLSDMDRSFTNVDKRLNVEQWSLGFEADVRKCLLITGKTKLLVTPRGQEAKPDPIKTIHVCANSNEREYIQESWALITEQTPDRSIVVDGRGITENRFAQVIRGRSNFSEFVNSLENANRKTILRKMQDFKKGDYFEQMEQKGVSVNTLGIHLDNAFPGLVD